MQPIDYPPASPPHPSSSPHPSPQSLQLSPSHILPSFLDTYARQPPGSGSGSSGFEPQGHKGEPHPTMLEHRFSFKPDPAEQQSHFSSPATSYHSSAQPHQSHQQSTFTTATGMFESLLEILKKELQFLAI